MPFLLGLEPTIRAMKALWFHAERQGRAPAAPPPVEAEHADAGDARADARGRTASRCRSRALATTPQAAARAAAEIGFPVALKIQSADILHKTEAGGVVARACASADEVKAAAAQVIVERAKRRIPRARIDGFLVQEMVSGVEAIVGARTDALYGPMLLVGAGGVLVELAGTRSCDAAGRRRREVAGDGR